MRSPRRSAGSERRDQRLERRDSWLILGALAALVLVNVPELGSDPWPFEPGSFSASGPLSFVVDAVGGEWDPEALRAGALLAGIMIALTAAASLAGRLWSPRWLAGLAVVVVALILLPAVFLQAALRDSTERWFFVNDSTYQIELAGEALRAGDDPYGHDYRTSGLERVYSFDGSVAYRFPGGPERPTFDHFVYFPGAALSGALWTILPSPLDDYRFFVALATLASFLAVLAFRAPLGLRLAVGAVAAANPLAVRAAWFGTADATSIVFLLFAFALLTRARWVAAAATLGVAIVFKQFAVVALPFFAVAVLTLAGRTVALRAAAACAGVLAVGFLPFIAWDPGAFFADTLPAGDDTYPIVGPGLSSLLVEAGAIADRTSGYPMALFLAVVWLPLTVWLIWTQWRARTLWGAAIAFTISIFIFILLGRIVQPSYFLWPLTGLLASVLLAFGPLERAEGR
jgi:hypothetical protein